MSLGRQNEKSYECLTDKRNTYELNQLELLHFPIGYYIFHHHYKTNEKLIPIKPGIESQAIIKLLAEFHYLNPELAISRILYARNLVGKNERKF